MTPTLSRRAAVALACSFAAAIVGCRGSLEVQPSDADVVLAEQRIDAPDPAEPGSHRVLRLYYGSGTDRHRPEYRDSVAITTDPVDASPFVDFDDEDARERKDWWGFGTDAFPLNARVWHPDGPGPFPLVLIVHGNHDPRDFSDPGYGYLGELFASRGYIFASIDMNFINGGIRGENDGRGWLLLKHLEAWHAFNRTEGNPFHGRVDTSRIALIGHSRGGGGVAHAAAFNRLSRYPDDANVEFDFGYAIRSIVAIAPVDGQYRPAEKLVPLEDVNYLVFHGSHDGDVTSFMGIRQYQRAAFTGDRPGFRASVYVYRANHGQWNTTWGAHDLGERTGRIYDLGTLMPAEDQRRFAKVYISAFLEATLRGDKRYLPLFRDHRDAGGWLPETMYITRFRDHTFRPLATYEGDIDLTTGGAAGVTITGEGLATWREGGLDLRSANSRAEGSDRANNAVWVGWNRNGSGSGAGSGSHDASGARSEPDSGTGDGSRRGMEGGGAPAYVVGLPDSLAAQWELDRDAALAFALAPTEDVPDPPDDDHAKGDREGETEADRVGREGEGSGKGEGEEEPIDLTVELVDAAGRRAGVSLSRYGAVRRPLEIQIHWRRDIGDERFATPYELLLQGYSLPLADFLAVNPALDPARLRAIRFVFDRSPAGTVVIDDIGFASPDPAFLVASGTR